MGRLGGGAAQARARAAWRVRGPQLLRRFVSAVSGGLLRGHQGRLRAGRGGPLMMMKSGCVRAQQPQPATEVFLLSVCEFRGAHRRVQTTASKALKVQVQSQKK